MTGRKALLVFPPQWTPQNPHFALRALAGHLRANGIEVAVRDLNVEYYDSILTPESLSLARDRIRLDLEYLGYQTIIRQMIDEQSHRADIDAARFTAMKRFEEHHPGALDRLPGLILDAKETLRDPRRYYNPDYLIDAFRTIDLALQALSLPYHPANLSYIYFDQPDARFTIRTAHEFANSPAANMFHAFFEGQIESLLAEEASYIGISINSFSQVLPGLTLAHMLRKAAPPGVHIGLGGNHLGRVKETLLERPDFFEYFAHSLATSEGEQQLVHMVQALVDGQSLEDVPNILFVGEDGVPRASKAAKPPQMDRIGHQDLAGLPMDLYFSPEPLLTIQASKGCYWGKCSFCDSFFGVDLDFKSIDKLVAEIRHLKETYGVRLFQFIDEALPPNYMEAMARRFIEEKLDIQWFSNGRLETGFTPDLMSLLHQAGLRMVLWGYETGAPRIHNLIKKGVAFSRRHDILRGAAEAGIFNFAYIFFGFPSETLEEANATIDAMCENTDIIHAYGRSVFTLGKQSPLYADLEKNGDILEAVVDIEDLSSNISFKTRGGMSDEELHAVMKSCTTRCSEAHDHALWFYLRSRENIHYYLARFGAEHVRKATFKRFHAQPVEQA